MSHGGGSQREFSLSYLMSHLLLFLLFLLLFLFLFLNLLTGEKAAEETCLGGNLQYR